MPTKLTLLALCLFPFITMAQPRDWYVRANANGANTGENWTNAFPSLQTALDSARYGDVIRVAQGKYLPTTNDPFDRNANFRLRNGVALYGGYMGTGTQADERNITAWPSRLSGDIGNAFMFEDNTYSVITAIGALDSNTVLDGFYVEEGYADKQPNVIGFGSAGGGLYCKTDNASEQQNFKIHHCVFGGNGALFGGAVFALWNEESRPEFRYCVFQYNYSQSTGGTLMINVDGSTPFALRNLDFIENFTAGDGADCYLTGGFSESPDIELSNCTFSTTENAQGGSCYISSIVDAADLRVDSCTFNGYQTRDVLYSSMGGNIHISRCTFQNNRTNLINLRTDQLDVSDAPDVVIEDCRFHQNIKGGVTPTIGIQTESGEAHIRRCTFSNNYFDYLVFLREEFSAMGTASLLSENNWFISNQGTLLHPYTEVDLIVRQNVFTLNTGPIYRAPGGVFSGDLLSSWEFCTFYNNKWSTGFPTANYMFDFNKMDSVVFNSCILGDYSTNPVRYLFRKTDAGSIQLKHTLYTYTTSQLSPNASVVFTDSTSLPGSAPAFKLTDSLDLHLTTCSPGYNDGDPLLADFTFLTQDIKGQSRVQNGLPDMGCFENFRSVEAFTQPSCLSQANGSMDFGGEACGPFSVVWEKNGVTDTTRNALSPGVYGVSVTDPRGNTFTLMAQVDSAVLAVEAIELSPIQCTGLSDGLVAAEVRTGVAPFDINWSNGQMGLVAFNLPAGELILDVVDALGCRTSDTITLTEPLPVQTEYQVTPASTPIIADGALTQLSIQGGTTPYRYDWNTGDTLSDLQGLLPGFYILTITDANGCLSFFPFEVDALSLVTNPDVGLNPIRLYPTVCTQEKGSWVSSDNEPISQLAVFDRSGKLMRILTPGTNTVFLEANNLTQGVYWVQVQTISGLFAMKKWVVQF